MSENASFYGEDSEDMFFDEIPEYAVTKNLNIESPEDLQEFKDERAQFEEAFKAEPNNKKVGKSSKDSEEKLSGQKSQSSSKAESPKKSIENEIRFLRKSLGNVNAQASNNLGIASQISTKSIVSGKVSITGEQQIVMAKESRKNSRKSIQLSDKDPTALEKKLVKPILPNVGQKSLAEKITGTRKSTTSQVPSLSHSSGMERAFDRHDEIQPTYQLGPQRPFSRNEASIIIDNVLSTYINDLVINVEGAAENVAMAIASDIRTLLKRKFDRVKILLQVFVSEKRRQGVNIDVRCLWDQDRDQIMVKKLETLHHVVQVICYGVYHD